jgi:LacI family transcriptional regulator
MAIDSKKLATLCRVSRGTVDRALNGRIEVKEATKARILRMAEKHGYRPNELGRALVTGRTMTVGVIVFDLANSFFSEIVSALEASLRERGYRMLLSLSQKDGALERQCIDCFAQKKVDGLVFIPTCGADELSAHLHCISGPVVVFGNRLASVPFVGIDERAAIHDAVAYVSARGYRHITYFCPPMRHEGTMNLWAQEERHEGFTAAARGFAVSHESIIDEREVTQRIANGFRERTAVICSNDIYAIRLLRYAESVGKSVPRDVGIMGFDNIAPLAYVRPRITTVAYPTEKVGRALAGALIAAIDKTKPAEEAIRHTIIIGETI